MKKKFINQMEPWIGEEEISAMISYLRSGGWLTEFKETQKFEGKIAEYVGSRYACVVNNGTVSLFIAVMGLGIGKGDEVLVPNLSMIASANAVILAGANPVLVDIEKETLCIDLQKCEKALSKNTKALIFVNLNGRSPDMDKVVTFCRKNKLMLLEDAAQSLGSKWRGKHLGTFGAIGSFSFSAPKIITTGQGGALVTDDRKLYENMRKIKDFGREKAGIDKHVSLGYNFKFTDIQAVIGIEQMKKLSFRVKRKKEIFSLYRKEIDGVKGLSFIKTNLKDTTPWFIDILVEKRNDLIKYLHKQGIGSRPIYPPIHTQSPYKEMKIHKKNNFPVSIEIANSGLWLPSASFLSDEKVRRVCKEIRNFYLSI